MQTHRWTGCRSLADGAVFRRRTACQRSADGLVLHRRMSCLPSADGAVLRPPTKNAASADEMVSLRHSFGKLKFPSSQTALRLRAVGG